MEKELLERGPVLDEKGRPIPGYSRRSTLVYDRKAIKAPPWRIKEWDFYQISNDRLCLQFTIGHAAYAGQVSLMLFDFVKGEKLLDLNKILVLPFGSLHMPENAEEDNTLTYDKGGIFMRFETRKDGRVLTCRWGDLEASIRLERKNPDSLVINLPFNEYAHAFYYNHKINCMTAEGFVKNADKAWHFEKDSSFGILDWGKRRLALPQRMVLEQRHRLPERRNLWLQSRLRLRKHRHRKRKYTFLQRKVPTNWAK